MVHAVESIFSQLYTNQCISIGITQHDTEIHGNNRLPPIDRMTVSPYTYCRMLGKIFFLIVLPISGSCQSMVYRCIGSCPNKEMTHTLHSLCQCVANVLCVNRKEQTVPSGISLSSSLSQTGIVPENTGITI